MYITRRFGAKLNKAIIVNSFIHSRLGKLLLDQAIAQNQVYKKTSQTDRLITPGFMIFPRVFLTPM